MIPVDFEQANVHFGPPTDLVESQCKTIPAFKGIVSSGSCDGVPLVVVSWKPTDEEISLMMKGCPIFLTMLGGLAPHFLSMSFEEAIKPS